MYPRARWATSAYRANGFTVSPGGPWSPRFLENPLTICIQLWACCPPRDPRRPSDAFPQETPRGQEEPSPESPPGDSPTGSHLPAPTEQDGPPYRLPPSKMDRHSRLNAETTPCALRLPGPGTQAVGGYGLPARRMRSMDPKTQACFRLRRCLSTCHWLLRPWPRHEGGAQRKAHLYPRARWATCAYRANGYTVRENPRAAYQMATLWVVMVCSRGQGEGRG